jgi:hypothetical protein
MNKQTYSDAEQLRQNKMIERFVLTIYGAMALAALVAVAATAVCGACQ